MNSNSLLAINRLDFNSFDDKTLGWKCIEPAIEKLRAKNLIIKSAEYAKLTPGQKSLLLFWVLYGHAKNGVLQFYSEVDYLISKTDIWTEFKDGFNRFGDNNLIDLVNQIEILYYRYQNRFTENSIDFLNDSDLLKTVKALDEKLIELLPESIKKIGRYIRNNPEEFVCFNDE